MVVYIWSQQTNDNNEQNSISVSSFLANKLNPNSSEGVAEEGAGWLFKYSGGWRRVGELIVCQEEQHWRGTKPAQLGLVECNSCEVPLLFYS